MIVELIKLANDLDNRGLVKEADVIDALLKDAGVLDWATGGGWKGDKPGWGDNPSTLESDQEKARKMRESVAKTNTKIEMGGSYPAGWGQGGEGFHAEAEGWLEDFKEAQRQNLTVDEYRRRGKEGEAGEWPAAPHVIPSAATRQEREESSAGLTDESTQGLPPNFVTQLRQLTPEQMKALGDLLMEGGPADAGDAQGLASLNKPKEWPTAEAG